MAGPLTPLLPLLPAIGKGLFWTGTAAGTAAGAYGLLGIPEDMRNDIIRQEPDDVTGEYKLNPFQKALLHEESLVDSRNKYVMKQAMKDGEIAQLQGLDSSLQLTNGMDKNAFMTKYAPQIRKIRTKEKIDEAKLIGTAAYNSDQEVEKRRAREQERRDLLTEQRLSRQDTNNRFLYSERMADKRRAHEATEGKLIRRHQSQLAENNNDLTMQMSLMQNDLSEKRMDYDRETRRLDKRSEAIAQLATGLGALGGLFAV